MAERTRVTVSIVATASYSGVESSTRRTPTSPAARAISSVRSKIRLGRSERASRARMSTSTVWAKPGASNGRPPQAYFQRASNVNRSTASRSDRPSRRWRTITTATTSGGTERRPTSANRSANSVSGKSSWQSRWSRAWIESGRTNGSTNELVSRNRSAWRGADPCDIGCAPGDQLGQLLPEES